MKFIWLLAALIVLVGVGQAFEKSSYGRRHSASETLTYLKSPTSFLDDSRIARRYEPPTPPARFQKLFWLPAYDYRNRPIWT